MKPLKISATEDTPEIIFDPINKIFKIAKVSLPEDTMEFYEPVIHWLEEYIENPLPETVFDFDLEYLNTASSKQIFEIIFLINKLHTEKNKDAKIRWYHDKVDEDMQTLGIRLSGLVRVDFEVIEYQREDDDDSDYFM